MNITKENISNSLATLTVRVEKADYEQNVSKALKDHQKKAIIPGFRPGKVPAGLIKKIYYKPVLADEVNKLITTGLNEYINNENINLLGDPLPNEDKQTVIDWSKDEDFEFIFDIAMVPEIKVDINEIPQLTHYTIIPDEEDIDKQVKAVAGRFGENIEIEEAGETDLLRGDFVQLDAEGNEKENGITAEQVLISIEVIRDETVKKEIIGKKPGDTIIFDPLKAYENKHEIGHMLNISHQEAEHIEGDFKFTISKVMRFQYPEINEDFFVKLFGEDTEVKTEEQFREMLKSDLMKTFASTSDLKFFEDVRNSLINTTKIELPEEFLKRWLKTVNKEVTEEQIETEFPEFLESLRWDIIRNIIVKDNNIKVEEDDLIAVARSQAELIFMQYGMLNAEDNILDKYVNSILQNEDERKHILSKVVNSMISDLMKSKANVTEKIVTKQEFKELPKS